DRPGLLGDRQIVYGRSAELIARSRLVLSHVSTALGLVVLFGKPVMLVVTEDHYRLTPGHAGAFDQAARSLGTPLRFIDDPAGTDLSGARSVDAEAYARYASRYIRHPDAPQGLLWDIVLDRIEGRTG
ncbi:MAG TPA: hypothetical protein VLL76_01825, partial [Candidatus Omnitrophota bacterium]|nr:hypothetical protein [Candidatus Omnitrophota bacterium]